MNNDNFFMELENTLPFVKAAFQGFAGSGKTYTAAQLAIGLHKKIKSTKPIVFFDTEKALKALKPLFDKAGIKTLVRESRTLKDLELTMHKLSKEGVADILVIDSITHVYENFIQEYKTQKQRTSLQFQDWGVIKPLWKIKFSDTFVNANTHIVFTGRAGYEYEDYIDDQGKRQIAKSGVKMKAEAETAYEPDLLFYMERNEDILGDKKTIWRECTVLKDRTTMIDSKTFKNPSFKDFEPAINVLLAGVLKEHEPTQEIKFKDYEPTLDNWKREKEIALEEITGLMTIMEIGQSAKEKALKAKILTKCFGTASWVKISESMPYKDIVAGKAILIEYKSRFMEYTKTCAATGEPFSIDVAEEMLDAAASEVLSTEKF